MRNSILTVTGAASVRALCTLAAVKLELGITDGSQDAALNERIAQASQAIESYCQRPFCRETVQEVFRPTRAAPCLYLGRFPIASITSIVADTVTLTAGTDYEFEPERGLIYRLANDARIDWTAAKVTVVYVAGYLLPDQSSPTLPADVQRAAVLTVASMMLGQGRDTMVRSESAQDVGSISYLDPRAGMESLPPVVAGLVDAHRVTWL